MKIGEQIRVLQRHSRHYFKYTVVGETSRSWLLIPEGQQWVVDGFLKEPTGHYANCVVKLPKAGEKKGDWKLGTEANENLAKWAVTNYYEIASRVQSCGPEILFEVAKLVGFPLPEEK